MTKETQPETTPNTEQPTPEKPMIIERVRATGDGGIEFIMSLTKEQTYVLVNFAVMALISQGLAVFADEPAPASQEDSPSEDAKAAETAQETNQEITLGKQLH